MNFSPPPKVAVLLAILPEELIVEVLSFIEVKYLMRMKCVCKSWGTLISDPVFVKMHLKKKYTRMIHLAILADKAKGSGDLKAVPIFCLMETTSNSIILTDPSYPFNYKDAGGIVGSCNGLVCLHGLSFAAGIIEESFCFWNPATRLKSETSVSFRSYQKEHSFCNFAFGYDNSTDTYKVVVLCLKRNGDLITSMVRVFTLGDNVWRDIDCFPVVLVHHRYCYFAKDGVYLNNSINWFVRHSYYCNVKNLTVEKFVIISLDLRKETYTQLLLPQFCHEELQDPPFHTPNLTVLMDCLCLYYDFKETYFVIWQMKEFGVEESWIQFLRISYLDLQVDYKFRELDYNYIPELILIPLCVSENGDTVMFAINREDQAIVYNLRDNRVKRIKSTNKIWWFDAKGYVESLVSIDFLKAGSP